MHRASGQIVQKQGVYSHDFLFDKYIRLLDEIKRLQVVLREVEIGISIKLRLRSLKI